MESTGGFFPYYKFMASMKDCQWEESQGGGRSVGRGKKSISVILSFTHVYYEHNMLADALSKQAQQVEARISLLKESINGSLTQSRSFIF
jgi:hypothetical protein